ncbi:MAG: response regulator [Deltaproteobacteria bacterium]|nr:response regulator [Deltaproteobacteria bacterium]
MKRRTARAPTLLLASKDKELSRHVRTYLSTMGLSSHGLVLIRNESEWQEALNRERPRLVILDDDISHGNGPTLLSALRRRSAEVLTVYLAEQHSLELERAVRQLGVLYYTEKPPDWDTLGRVLASVLSVHAPAPSFSGAPSPDT